MQHLLPLLFYATLLSRVCLTLRRFFVSRINVSHMAICCCHAWSQMRMIRPFWKAHLQGLSIDKLTKQRVESILLFVSWTKLEKNEP